MAGNTFKMLELLGATLPADDIINSLAEYESVEQKTPQLSPAMRMGEKLEELLSCSLGANCTPMDN